MTLAGILKGKPAGSITIIPETRIDDVVKLLAEKSIGALPVMNATGGLLGILSERDIVRSLATKGAATLDMTASELMTASPTSATRHISVADAMEMMTNGRFRHLPIVEDGQLIGIVSIGDVVKARLSQQEYEVDSLRAYVAGAA